MTDAITRSALALTLSMLAVGIAACGAPPTAAALVSQGLKAQLAGDETTAETTYQQAIKLDPNNAVAHYDLGTVYDRQGSKAQAVTEYTATLVIDPTFADALFNLAVDTVTTDSVGAEKLYLRVLALQPNFAAAWLNLGFILQGQAKLPDARSDWAKAVALDSSLASHVPAPTPATTAPAAKP
jgi:tetratricopeptide (TPR) repeat protein